MPVKRLMIVALFCAATSFALPSEAVAQDAVAGYVGQQVRVRAPGETAWRMVPAAELPPNARIVNRRQDSWVEIELPGNQRLQVNWNNVQQRVAGNVVCLPGSVPTAAAGSQGLGARGC
jgi:hypothetical protein